MTLYPLCCTAVSAPWSGKLLLFGALFWAGLGICLSLALINRFAASVAGFAFVFSVSFSCLLWPNYLVALG